MTDPQPRMEPRPLRIFSEWYSQVTWPSGHTEQVHSFKSEAHARGWIASESQAWIVGARGPRE